MLKSLLYLLPLLFTSCQGIPLLGGGDDPGPPKRTDTGEVLAETGQLVSEFKWLLLLTLLFIPSARNAVGEFMTALFRGLALPFTVLVSRFSSTGGGLSQEEIDSTDHTQCPTEDRVLTSQEEPSDEPTRDSRPQ